jgi:2-polyprenyl-6-hydroxyphenyl methylase/3-demethylubiquinone-9 3-methyltransferase
VNPLRAAVRRAVGLAVDAGALPYRPVDRATVSDWDQEYASGEIAYYGELHELGRYSVLVGYVRHLGPGVTLVDVGCGPGILRARLADVPFGRYLGVDPSEVAIEQASALADERTRLVRGELPLPDEAPFDIAVLNEVLYVVPDPPELLDRVADAVRPGGHVLTSIWRHPGDRALTRLVRERFEPLDEVEVRNLTQPRASRVALYRRP